MAVLHSREARAQQAPACLPDLRIEPARLDHTIDAARTWLFDRQQSAGFWCADFEGDTTLEAYLILLESFLGRRQSDKNLAMARVIRADMLPNGGWSQYVGGPAEISVSCLSYLALKLVGDSADAAHIQLARAAILQLGGVHRANTYTKYHFAFFGQYSWRDVPAIPPELMLLPRGGPFTIYDMSSWSRTIFLPLSILYAKKPVCAVPPECGARELMIGEPGFERPTDADPNSPPNASALRWRKFFLLVDRALKLYERVPGAELLRRISVARAGAWMIQRFEDSDG
ncbi:MAG: Squalene--hopene cyclase, partial [Pseudomonadota bacterium]